MGSTTDHNVRNGPAPSTAAAASSSSGSESKNRFKMKMLNPFATDGSQIAHGLLMRLTCSNGMLSTVKYVGSTSTEAGTIRVVTDWVFIAIMGVFVLLFVGVVVVIVVAVTRNARAARQAGLDPLTAQTQLAGRLYASEALAPARPPEQRLAELEGLRSRGLVTPEEYQQARQRIIGSL